LSPDRAYQGVDGKSEQSMNYHLVKWDGSIYRRYIAECRIMERHNMSPYKQWYGIPLRIVSREEAYEIMDRQEALADLSIKPNL
jgi:hypothetical protein